MLCEEVVARRLGKRLFMGWWEEDQKMEMLGCCQSSALFYIFLKISLAFEENELLLDPADKLTIYFEITEDYILNPLFYCVLRLLICL